MKNRKNYTREFKLQVLRESKYKPLAQVSREHNIHHSSICRWKKEYEENPQKAFNGKGNLWKHEAEIAKYERLVGQLYAENALLKKALVSLQERQAEERMLRSIK